MNTTGTIQYEIHRDEEMTDDDETLGVYTLTVAYILRRGTTPSGGDDPDDLSVAMVDQHGRTWDETELRGSEWDWIEDAIYRDAEVTV